MSSQPPDGAGPGARVVVLGSLNADLVVTTEQLPAPGQTVTGGSFARHWGGKGANQAVAAASYGAEVSMVGAVGDDQLGRGCLEALEQAGVDTTGLQRDPERSTGVALVVVDARGENQIAVAPGANAHAQGGALDRLVDPSRRGVVLISFEVPDEAVTRALRLARAAGWRLVVNPAPARRLVEAFEGSGALLTPNRGELATLTEGGGQQSRPRGRDELVGLARTLVREVTGAPVVVTLGAEGALVVDGDRHWHHPAPSVAVRDTTGAGDVFNGVLAACLAEGARPAGSPGESPLRSQGTQLRRAVVRATAAAAASTETAGARGDTPTRAELTSRLTDPDRPPDRPPG